MGGHALKNTLIKRIDLANYKRIKEYISKLLESEGYTISEIKETPGKESFGDLDLLYLTKTNQDIRQSIIKLFNPNEIVSNGNVCSFDFDEFQIDLIKCTSLASLQFAKFYFSYGDVGGILGRICSAYGLKFGHDGLHAVLFENTIYPEIAFDVNKHFNQILLSDNPENVCAFLGLDWAVYSAGLTNVHDIFDWIILSKYFNTEIFTVFNHENIKRLHARPMYIQFIEHIGINTNKINRGFQLLGNQQSEAIKYFDKYDILVQIMKDLDIKKTVYIISQIKKIIGENYQTTWNQWIYNSEIDTIYKLLDDVITTLKL